MKKDGQNKYTKLKNKEGIEDQWQEMTMKDIKSKIRENGHRMEKWSINQKHIDKGQR